MLHSDVYIYIYILPLLCCFGSLPPVTCARSCDVRHASEANLLWAHCRHTLCVHMPVQAKVFEQLPEDIRKGHKVQVCPAFFNIGINEDATYAETR